MLTFQQFADREGVNLSLLGDAEFCALQARLEDLQPEMTRADAPDPATDLVAPF